MGSIILIIGAIYFFGRKNIRKWWFKRKISPSFDKSISLYEEILPDFVEEKPKIKVIDEKDEIPEIFPLVISSYPRARKNSSGTPS